jgi:hypothetical protein
MWFTWSSGACGSFVPHPPRAAGRGTRCRSSDPRLSMPRFWAPGHGPRHASTSTGATCGGKKSDRSCGSLAVHCCPPRPWNASPRSGPRGPSIGPLTGIRMQVRATLLTLAPTFPTRSGPCDPAAKPGFLSWGCPKIAPPPYFDRGIRLPVARFLRRRRARAPRFRGPPSRWERQFPPSVPSSWFLTTPTVCSSSTVRPFAGRCRSWGSPRFLLSRNRIPRDAPSALRSFPSADSYGRRDESRPSVGPRHRPSRCRPVRSPRTLPPHPFSSAIGTLRFPAVSLVRIKDRGVLSFAASSTRPYRGSRGLEALLHRRVRCARERFHPPAPGAPLGLSGRSAPAALQKSPRMRGITLPASEKRLLSPRAGRAVQRDRVNEPTGCTSKTTPKSVSSV